MAEATSSSSSGPPRGEPVWYIQAAARVWGPYRRSRMEGFVSEGRLSAQSLVASQASGPFSPAGRRRELEAFFPTPQAGAHRVAAPAVAAGVQPSAVPSAPAVTLIRPLLVWAFLRSLTPERFETLLAVHGPLQAIRPGLWFVRAHLGPAALRNALSRRLSTEDALLVAEAPLSGAAWFNLDGSAERSLRQLWGAGDPIRNAPSA